MTITNIGRKLQYILKRYEMKTYTAVSLLFINTVNYLGLKIDQDGRSLTTIIQSRLQNLMNSGVPM
ncbi:MAG: hypothetical protein ACI9Y7_001234 [Dokdonia sp.]|jgi:hypothetical protein